MLADAVAHSASPEVKAEFVKALAAKADKHQDAGVSIVQVLNSMKDSPALLQQTIKDIDAQLPAIIDGAAQKTVVSTRNGTVTNYDPEPLAELLNTVSKLQGEGAAEQKARIFDLAANKITEIRSNATAGNVVPFIGSSLYQGQPAEDLIRNGLTKLINSDTVGISSALEKDNKGKGLKAYVKSMLDTGNKTDQDAVGTMIARLLTGNGNNENQIARFERQTPGTTGLMYNQNARTLGFFAGAVHAATASMSGDRAKQANAVKNVFGTAASIVGVALPSAAAPAAGATGLTNQMVDDVVSKMDDEGYDIRDGLLEMTMPQDANGHLYTGPARDSYDAAFGATAARNNR